MENENPSTINFADEKRRRQMAKLKKALASLDGLSATLDRAVEIEERCELRNRSRTHSSMRGSMSLIDPRGLTPEELEQRIEERNERAKNTPTAKLKSSASGVCGSASGSLTGG